MGDACISRRGHLLLDVCGYPVSLIVSVDVSLEGDVLSLPCLARHLFFPNIWGLATLTKLKTRMRICRTTFGTVTLEVHHLRGTNGIPFLTEH